MIVAVLEREKCGGSGSWPRYGWRFTLRKPNCPAVFRKDTWLRSALDQMFSLSYTLCHLFLSHSQFAPRGLGCHWDVWVDTYEYRYGPLCTIRNADHQSQSPTPRSLRKCPNPYHPPPVCQLAAVRMVFSEKVLCLVPERATTLDPSFEEVSAGRCLVWEQLLDFAGAKNAEAI